MSRRLIGSALLIATAIMGIVIGRWLAGGSHLITAYTSPDRTEQLEIDTPARWQQVASGNSIVPAVARLVSLQDDRVIAASEVFDFGGGIGDQIFWSRDGVQISTVLRYRRLTNRWTRLQ